MTGMGNLEDKLVVHTARKNSSPLETAWDNFLKVKEELDELHSQQSFYFDLNQLKESAIVYERKGEYLKAALIYFKEVLLLNLKPCLIRPWKV